MPRVIIRRCEAYDADRIRALIGEALDELGVRPRGRVLVKPNTVIAHPRLFPHAFTRAEVLDGLLGALRERATDVTDLAVGERCGITIPTRHAFAQAGYLPVLRKHRVRASYFDEMPQVRRDVRAQGRLRDFVYVPRDVAEADLLVAVPKFKAHPWTKVTFNLKLAIGLQDDSHRLIDHDHHLHTKIADLFDVARPGLCVVDGIIAGAKTMLTPEPFPLGLLIVGDDALATDVVCTRIAGLDPADVEHLRIVSERGWGSLDLTDITLGGDVSLDEARARAEGFGLTLDPIDSQFNGRSNLSVYLGRPPDTYPYCSGGCPGALTEAVGIIGQLQPNVRAEIRRMHLVYGAYEGSITPGAGEKVLFIGDCARWRGSIAGAAVEIPFLYRERHLLRPEVAPGRDLLIELARFFWARLTGAGRRVVRVHGCTVSVAETVLYLWWYGGARNPYLHPDLALSFFRHYLVSRAVRWWVRLRTRRRQAIAAGPPELLPP
jgi:uncharacterized protein (DUF362 family)